MQSNDNTIKRDKYENPLVSRYASKEMSYIWSPEKKFTTWRALWVHLAEGEKELGLDISDDQILELKRFQGDINYSIAEQKEKEVRHDVMSHVYAYGVQCPSAKGIIHLGATSCFIGNPMSISKANFAKLPATNHDQNSGGVMILPNL